MSDFVTQLLASRKQRDDLQLAWELGHALNEKHARGEAFSAAEKLAWQVCAVAHCDGIEALLGERVADIAAAAEFAAARGLPKTAEMLANAARGVPVPGPVSFSVKFQGKEMMQDLPQSAWGATDLALSLVDEDLDAAILDLLGERRAEFKLAAPAKVQARDSMAARIATLAQSASAAELLARFATHRNARIRASLSEYDRKGKDSDWITVPVTHQFGDPADTALLQRMRAPYGAVIDDLLAAYARHDGAALYVAGEEAGFHFLPIAQWAEHGENVMDWATNVTWGNDPEELPDYLESAIAFGFTPYDSERWILVTQGKWAGQVMLSDTDTIEDEPRFASIHAFFAALTLDLENVLGNGGFVSYQDGNSDELYYPMLYLHD